MSAHVLSEKTDRAADTTILIVDDEPGERMILEALLEGQGYRLEMAENGTEALEKASRIQPDLILLDVVMPGMDGFEVCGRIRGMSSIAEVPVLMLTSLDDKGHLLKGFDAGADDYIAKPCDCMELRARLATITRLNRYRKLLEGRSNLEVAHARLMDAYDATISGWSRAMELRDEETEGHSQRVTLLTEKLARFAGIQDTTHIRRGALLHDIGKLGVPDAILLKPGRLTEEEWAIMKQHPQFAHDMIYPIEYLRPALDIPFCHHEKWDGTGYPRGLKGDEIPLAARLFAVVDVWDALTSERPYRKAWNHQMAGAFISQQKGTHFDPDVADLFLRMMEQEVSVPRSQSS